MNHLLLKDTFDSFLVRDAQINTAAFFQIDGHINQDFFNEDERVHHTEDYIFWNDVRPIAYEIIKGKKVPTGLKITFAFPKSKYPGLIKEGDLPFDENQISGMYLHIHYDGESVQIITGTSLSLFTMDKSLDSYWDSVLSRFLSSHFETI